MATPRKFRSTGIGAVQPSLCRERSGFQSVRRHDHDPQWCVGNFRGNYRAHTIHHSRCSQNPCALEPGERNERGSVRPIAGCVRMALAPPPHGPANDPPKASNDIIWRDRSFHFRKAGTPHTDRVEISGFAPVGLAAPARRCAGCQRHHGSRARLSSALRCGRTRTRRGPGSALQVRSRR
jgi:hypothetical protein